MCGIMLVLRVVLNMLVRNASPRGPMYFRCLMFNLPGPCELLFLLCFIACLTVFVNCLVKQFAIILPSSVSLRRASGASNDKHRRMLHNCND